MRRTLLLLILVLCGHSAATAQSAQAGHAAPLVLHGLDAGYYTHPVPDAAKLYSANFGEMRPNHFHSGVDIKTDGVTGRRVVAAADGYIARIGIAPWGYGRVLYIAHPNGTTTVYGHLDRFRDDIEAYVRRRRYELRESNVDLWCSPADFPVRRGEEVARSGNSGASMGPHLHFEVRRTDSQRTLNVLAAGLLPVRDDIAPRIVRLHYVELDSLRGVPVANRPRTFDVEPTPDGFRLRGGDTIDAGRIGYLLAEVTDRKNDVHNTFGIYRLRAEIDGACLYEYRMDGFLFGDTRYCNAVSYYPMQLTSRNEVIRLARVGTTPLKFFSALPGRGIVRTGAGEHRRLRIEIEDDCGNRSELRFVVRGKADERRFRAPEPADTTVVHPQRDFRIERGEVGLSIPRGLLYEPVFYSQKPYGRPRPEAPGVRLLSEGVTVMDARLPLHGYATLSIRCDVPEALRPHALLASLSPAGKLRSEGGAYADGAVSARTRSLGTFFVAVDTVPPAIKPSVADGADCRTRSSLTLQVTDNFAGVRSVEATVDGEWVILEQQGNRYTHRFDADRYGRDRRHELVCTATDGAGNRTVRKLTFTY